MRSYMEQVFIHLPRLLYSFPRQASAETIVCVGTKKLPHRKGSEASEIREGVGYGKDSRSSPAGSHIITTHQGELTSWEWPHSKLGTATELGYRSLYFVFITPEEAFYGQ